MRERERELENRADISHAAAAARAQWQGDQADQVLLRTEALIDEFFLVGRAGVNSFGRRRGKALINECTCLSLGWLYESASSGG